MLSKTNAIPALSPNDIERFWSKVDKQSPNGCWLWTAGLVVGYGQFQVRRHPYKAHRVSFEMVNGPIPAGLFLLHCCPGGDNPRCVNPDHLRVGTPKENALDRKERGKQARGDNHPLRLHPEFAARGEEVGRAKLNEQAVAAIRKRVAEGGVRLRQLADEYGVSPSAIGRVIAQRNWKHVDSGVVVASPGRRWSARFTDEEIHEIRSQYQQDGITQVQLAAKYNVSQRAISLIVRREIYRCVA